MIRLSLAGVLLLYLAHGLCPPRQPISTQCPSPQTRGNHDIAPGSRSTRTPYPGCQLTVVTIWTGGWPGFARYMAGPHFNAVRQLPSESLHRHSRNVFTGVSRLPYFGRA